MSRKPGSLQGLVVKKGEATSSNTYIGDAAPTPEKAPRKKATPVPAPAPEKIDGRTLRRTGRTHKFAATVKPEWAHELKSLAATEGRLIVEILEDALEAYKKKGKR